MWRIVVGLPREIDFMGKYRDLHRDRRLNIIIILWAICTFGRQAREEGETDGRRGKERVNCSFNNFMSLLSLLFKSY